MTLQVSRWVPVLLLASSSIACSVEETHVRCADDSDCESGEECYLGYCILGGVDAATGSKENNTRRQRDAMVAKEDAGRQEDAGEAPPPRCTPSDDDAGVREGACCTQNVACYDGPAATRGVGRCRAGRRTCTRGVLGPCVGSVLPRAENCENESTDDDCDGVLNNIRGRGESCTLPRDSMMCGGGRMECVTSKSELACVAARVLSDETCNRWDDDCDNKVDETFDLQRDLANCGACGTKCGANQVCCSGSCGARTANTPNGCACNAENPCQAGTTCCDGACRNLQTDRASCGMCGRSCAANESCCGGKCVDLRADPTNCGRCGTSCTQGMAPACCNGRCTDTTIDELNCGRCGGPCNGLLCACEPQNGKGMCISRVGGTCN